MDSLAHTLMMAMIEKEANAPRNLGIPYRGPKLINQMPDDCVEAVLNRLPRKELLLHRAVCSKWNILIEDLCRRQCKSVLISLSSSTYHNYSLNLVKRNFFGDLKPQNFICISNAICAREFYRRGTVDSLLNEILPFMFRLFRRPTQLIADLCFWQEGTRRFAEQFFTQLFSQWSPHLTTLSLEFYLVTDPSDDSLISIAINSCVKLKHLNILVRPTFQRPSSVNLPSLLRPTLQRIEYFSCNLDLNLFIRLLGPNCTRVWYDYSNEHLAHVVEDFEDLSSTLFTHITHFGIFYSMLSILPEERICSLKVLSLHSFCRYHRLDQLASFSQLIELHLDGIFFEENHYVIDLTRAHTPIPSLRRLYLTHDTLYQQKPALVEQDLFFITIAAYFPNLERFVNRCSTVKFYDFRQFSYHFPKLIAYESEEFGNKQEVKRFLYVK